MKNMTMEQKRKAVIGAVILAAVMILLGNTVIAVAGLVLGFMAIAIQCVWFRCPHCRIFIQIWNYKEDVECPQCGKKLG